MAEDRSKRGKAEVIKNRVKIARLMASGYGLAQIHRDLKASGKITINYPAFHRWVIGKKILEEDVEAKRVSILGGVRRDLAQKLDSVDRKIDEKIDLVDKNIGGKIDTLAVGINEIKDKIETPVEYRSAVLEAKKEAISDTVHAVLAKKKNDDVNVAGAEKRDEIASASNSVSPNTGMAENREPDKSMPPVPEKCGQTKRIIDGTDSLKSGGECDEGESVGRGVEMDMLSQFDSLAAALSGN